MTLEQLEELLDTMVRTAESGKKELSESDLIQLCQTYAITIVARELHNYNDRIERDLGHQ